MWPQRRKLLRYKSPRLDRLPVSLRYTGRHHRHLKPDPDISGHQSQDQEGQLASGEQK